MDGLFNLAGFESASNDDLLSMSINEEAEFKDTENLEKELQKITEIQTAYNTLAETINKYISGQFAIALFISNKKQVCLFIDLISKENNVSVILSFTTKTGIFLLLFGLFR